MTASAAIDLLVNFYVSSSSTDADNATLRTRLLQYLQEIYDEVWYYREWPFRRRSATLTVNSAATNADLPADFGEVGGSGGVWLVSDGRHLEELSSQQLEMGIQNGDLDGSDDHYAVYGYNTTTNRKLFQVSERGANTDYKVLYLATAPALVDTTGAGNNLEKVPEQYHNSVLIPGTTARIRKHLGDQADWYSQYRTGLASMVSRERTRKGIVQRLAMQRLAW